MQNATKIDRRLWTAATRRRFSTNTRVIIELPKNSIISSQAGYRIWHKEPQLYQNADYKINGWSVVDK